MANRFPLIVNPTTKEIQEIAQNDNLDLTGNGIYAGGSLGQNGQVLTTNGTTVEWRTLTSSGGGGGSGGIDSDTTYIIEAEDQLDGASLNLVAGGSGVGTIRIKFLDNAELQFDTVDSLTVAPKLKTGGVANDKLENPGYTFRIDGVDTQLNLGETVVIPLYGDVFKTATQEISNKTFTNCTMSLASSTGNSLVSIPNSSLINRGININGQLVELGGSITISGGGGIIQDTDTTYTLSAVDWSENGVNNPAKKAIRLTGSDASTSNAVLSAGNGLSISRNGNEIEITNTESDTDTDTTYNISTDTLTQGNVNTGARLNLNATSNNVKTGATTTGAIDRVSLRNGTGVTVSSISSDDIEFSIGQDVSASSNVQFNNLTLTGNFIVEGATTFVDTTNLVISDKTITIGDGATSSLLANGAGILIGTSNINFTYSHADEAWTATSDINVAPTKTYKVGGNEVLTSNKVLGKSMPLGDVIGTIDTQTLSNKTILSPVMTEIINTGTVYFPAPPVAETLVGRATSDILTNKSIDGNNNTITNIGNSSISNAFMIINGTTRYLGDTFAVTASDPYNDEKAQDAVAGSLTNGNHSGISFAYDDTTGRINATVTAGGQSSDTLATVTARGATTNDTVVFGDVSNAGEFRVSLESGNYLKVFGSGGETYIRNQDNDIGSTASTINIEGRTGVALWQGTGNLGLQVDSNCAVKLYYQSSQKLETTSTGVTITGALTAGGLTYPTANGTSGQVLTSDGAGNVTWGAGSATPSSISDGTSTLGFNSNNDLELACHIIPDTNATHDIGSAEYKIRHLYLSQNTLYYEGEYLKVAQHNTGGVAGQASYMLPLSKIKEVLNASVDFETFKTNMLAIVDAAD